MESKLYTDAGGALDTARSLITGDRAAAHGDAFAQAATAAQLWTTYLSARGAIARAIEPYEVMMLLDLLKTSRDALGAFNPDTFVDKAGYAALAFAVRQKQVDLWTEQYGSKSDEGEDDGA